MLRWRQPLPALLRLFSTSCRRHSRLPTPPHPPNANTCNRRLRRRPPSRCRRTGGRGATPATGCATRPTPTSRPSSPPRTPTPSLPKPAAAASARASRPRCTGCPLPSPPHLSPGALDFTVDYDTRKKTFTILHQEEVTAFSSSVCTVGLQSNVSSFQQNLQLIEDSQSWSDLSKLFSCERVQVMSHDGVSVPSVILYSREAQRHGESPGILYGYGAYGEDPDKSWCSDRLSLLARGVEGIHHGIWQAPKLTR